MNIPVRRVLSSVLGATMALSYALAAAQSASPGMAPDGAANRPGMQAPERAATPKNNSGKGVHDANQATAPVLVIIPASDPDRPPRHGVDGCWVRLMDNIDTNKGNESMTILGVKYMPDLKSASGEDWARKMDGISIGPDALVTVFPEPGYKGHPVILRPNQVLQDFHNNSGFMQAVESMKIDCRG